MAGKMNNEGRVLMVLLQATRLYVEKMQAISTTEYGTHRAFCSVLNIH
jgi:hypothetical protein